MDRQKQHRYWQSDSLGGTVNVLDREENVRSEWYIGGAGNSGAQVNGGDGFVMSTAAQNLDKQRADQLEASCTMRNSNASFRVTAEAWEPSPNNSMTTATIRTNYILHNMPWQSEMRFKNFVRASESTK
jgi:hypothetical protein